MDSHTCHIYIFQECLPSEFVRQWNWTDLYHPIYWQEFMMWIVIAVLWNYFHILIGHCHQNRTVIVQFLQISLLYIVSIEGWLQRLRWWSEIGWHGTTSGNVTFSWFFHSFYCVSYRFCAAWAKVRYVVLNALLI